MTSRTRRIGEENEMLKRIPVVILGFGLLMGEPSEASAPLGEAGAGMAAAQRR